MDYIVDFKPYIATEIDVDYYADIERRISRGEAITENEADNFLRTIIYQTRKNINPNLDNFDYKCDLAQSILGNYFEEIHCPIIHCSTLRTISSKAVGHNFSIATLNVEGEQRPYLLDATYIQFFRPENCQFNKYFINPNNSYEVLTAPDPGYFIKEEDQEATEYLLRNGYIELTPEYAKMYGDSFYNTKQGIDPHPLDFKGMPASIYLKTFEKGNETLSTSRETLMSKQLNIQTFNEQKSISRSVG